MKTTLKQTIETAARNGATKEDLAETLQDLIEAAEGVISSLEKGDLAGAVNNLDARVEWASEVLSRFNRIR